LTACDQSTPEVACPEEAIISFATPPPLIEAISACEELFGIPMAQVPRFHTIAAINNAKMIAYPPALPT
jgi:hypothetical protein